MRNWQQAWGLATFELQASKLSFLFLLFIYPLFTLGIITSFDEYLDMNFVGIDLIFILSFTFAPIWTKPKQFQIQKMGSGLMAAPTVFMCQQLPITRNVIIKSRFIIYFIYTLPVQLLFLSALYILSPNLQALMSLGSYFSFSIIWLSVSVYIGGAIPASEVGDDASTMKMTIYTILMVIGVIAFFTFIQMFSAHGLVYWTIIFATKWPIISSLSSIILAIIAFNYWQKHTKKTMGKLDYL